MRRVYGMKQNMESVEERVRRLKSIYRIFYSDEGRDNSDSVVICAPGRAEILGNHTDYNNGLTISANIKNNLLVVGEKTEGENISVSSISKEGRKIARFSLTDQKDPKVSWSNYIKGVVWSFLKHNIPVVGFNALIESDIPQGMGLSSSAALELGTAHFICEVQNIKLPSQKLIEMTKYAENNFVGVPCGYLDQATIELADNNFLFIDHFKKERFLATRNLDVDIESLDLKFVIGFDEAKKHELTDGKYKERKKECKKSCLILSRILERKIKTLRDLEIDEFSAVFKKLVSENHTLALRVKHIIEENQRVLDFEQALWAGDFQKTGEIFSRSGYSGINNYGLDDGAPQLRFVYQNTMVNRKNWGVLGIRNIGGGFNPTTLSLVYNEDLEKFKQSLNKVYKQRYGRDYQFIDFTPAPSVKRLFK